jgi:hypothetical protein
MGIVGFREMEIWGNEIGKGMDFEVKKEGHIAWGEPE